MRQESPPSDRKAPAVAEAVARRMHVPGIADAVLGGLAYLWDSHVHDASDYTGSYFDYLISTSRAKKPIPRLAAGFRGLLGKYIVREHHLQGTWPGYIHTNADLLKGRSKPLIVVADYNLYTTASTAYSLLLFDERGLPPENRIVGAMLENASRAIRGFRRDDAFNFWRTKDHPGGTFKCSAPLNVPVSLLGFWQSLYYKTGLSGPKDFRDKDILLSWGLGCYNKRLNPTGPSAVFNIPNDADNTSMATAFQVLYHQWAQKPLPPDDVQPLECLPLYRDLGRIRRPRYYEALGEDTGAFLTWLKDEELPTFSFPEKGIMPLGMNNVDIVINANALFALSLADKRSLPGYRGAVSLIAQTIKQRKWPDSSIYYPQKYVFPYAVSRALRDARVSDPVLDEAMTHLIIQILDEQDSTVNPTSFSGGSPGAQFPNDLIHATALVLITLLNAGRGIADDCGVSEKYDRVVEKSIRTLLLHRSICQPRQKRTSSIFAGTILNFWESGILYSSLQRLAHWRSHAQTTSLVMEALVKYMLCYDLTGDNFPVRQLSLVHRNNRWSLSSDPANVN